MTSRSEWMQAVEEADISITVDWLNNSSKFSADSNALKLARSRAEALEHPWPDPTEARLRLIALMGFVDSAHARVSQRLDKGRPISSTDEAILEELRKEFIRLPIPHRCVKEAESAFWSRLKKRRMGFHAIQQRRLRQR